MRTEKKREVIELVRRSPVAKRETLVELGSAGFDLLSLAAPVSGRRGK